MKYSKFTGLMASAFVAMVSAQFTVRTNPPTAGMFAIHKPGLNEQVPKGEPYMIQWEPSETVPKDAKVNIFLLRGPSENIKFHSVIALEIPNTGTHTWTPPDDLEVDESRYGMRLDQVGSDVYQYSTQFGIAPAKGGKPPSGTEPPPTYVNPQPESTVKPHVPQKTEVPYGTVTPDKPETPSKPDSQNPYGQMPPTGDKPTVIYSTHITTITACDCKSTAAPDSTPGYDAPPAYPSGMPPSYGNQTLNNNSTSPKVEYSNDGMRVEVGGVIIAVAFGFVIAFL
jgi:hypothetical protein